MQVHNKSLFAHYLHNSTCIKLEAEFTRHSISSHARTEHTYRTTQVCKLKGYTVYSTIFLLLEKPSNFCAYVGGGTSNFNSKLQHSLNSFIELRFPTYERCIKRLIGQKRVKNLDKRTHYCRSFFTTRILLVLFCQKREPRLYHNTHIINICIQSQKGIFFFLSFFLSFSFLFRSYTRGERGG